MKAIGSSEIEILRPYHVCGYCHEGQSPRDRELDVEGTEYSPALRRTMALVGNDESFEHGCQQLDQLAGLHVTAKAVERQAEAIGQDIAQREQALIQQAIQLDLPEVAGQDIPVMYLEMDATGIPVVAAETEGRQGKAEGQPSHTREVKLGWVFTQSATDEEGRCVRDEGSTSYTGAIETAEEFGRRLFREAWVAAGAAPVRKWSLAMALSGSGISRMNIFPAPFKSWIFIMPGSICGNWASKLFPADEQGRKKWSTRLEKKLDAGKIETLVKNLRDIPAPNAVLAELLDNEANFFERNAERMRYAQFRSDKLFVGSGVIEAGCKTVIGKRLKMSGMFWTVRGANAIIALRCNRLSGKFEDYWESRRAA